MHVLLKEGLDEAAHLERLLVLKESVNERVALELLQLLGLSVLDLDTRRGEIRLDLHMGAGVERLYPGDLCRLRAQAV